jgi:hypothetical protein
MPGDMRIEELRGSILVHQNAPKDPGELLDRDVKCPLHLKVHDRLEMLPMDVISFVL